MMAARRAVAPSPFCFWGSSYARRSHAPSVIRGCAHGRIDRSVCMAAVQNGSKELVTDVSKRTHETLQSGLKLLNVVLVSPQIPGNTGSVARTCAAAEVALHLVEPLGYEISDAKLKRAGLDYWPYVVVRVHPSWDEFFQYFLKQEGEKRLVAFTKRGTTLYTDVTYRPGDWLLFGSEVDGLPSAAIRESTDGVHAGGAARIPICETYVRCLNLSVSVGIGVYEALRQLDQVASLDRSGRDEEPAMVDGGGFV